MAKLEFKKNLIKSEFSEYMTEFWGFFVFYWFF